MVEFGTQYVAEKDVRRRAPRKHSNDVHVECNQRGLVALILGIERHSRIDI